MFADFFLLSATNWRNILSYRCLRRGRYILLSATICHALVGASLKISHVCSIICKIRVLVICSSKEDVFGWKECSSIQKKQVKSEDNGASVRFVLSLETNSFMRRNFEFHGLKLRVSSRETISSYEDEFPESSWLVFW